MLAKVHSRTDDTGTVTVTAICDKELVGSVLEEGDLFIDLKTYAGFYRGEEVSEVKAIALVKKATNLNLVGRKAIAAARKAIELNEENIIMIAGEPHLQVYVI